MENKDWILQKIRECLSPVRIYLLANMEKTNTTTTIFAPSIETVRGGSQKHLLITTNDFSNKNSNTLEENIQAKCGPHTTLTCWVTHEEDFLKGISQQDFFYSHTCLYATPLLLPGDRLPVSTATVGTLRKPDPSCFINRAEQFIATTRLLLLYNQPTMASFQLHQATEQLLSALIIDSTGFRPPTHNLERLLTCARYFKPALCNEFCSSPEDERCLQQLQKAYVNSRYNNDFSMNKVRVERLLEKINTLLKNLITAKQKQ